MATLRRRDKRESSPVEASPAQKRRKERDATYRTGWPPETGTYHHIRVGEDSENRSVIVQILQTKPTISAVEMAPAPAAAAPWITEGEYLRKAGQIWPNLKKTNFDGPAQMASMAARALGKPGIFTRNAELGDDETVASDEPNTECRNCNGPLRAIDYSHCHTCESYVHNACTTAAAQRPFQIIGNNVCDNGGTPVECRQCTENNGCSTTIKTVDDPVTRQRHRVTFLFDFGSETTRLSISVVDGDPKHAEWEQLDKPLVSSFWINKESKDVKVSINEYEHDSPDAQHFNNAKRLLYDPEFRKQLETFGIKQPVKKVFRAFLDESFTRAYVEQNDRIRACVNCATTHASTPEEALSRLSPAGRLRAMTERFTAHASLAKELSQLPPLECYISVATPARVDEEQRCELLTAVSAAGTKFFEDRYKLPGISPIICDVREPEMALAGVPGSGLWTNISSPAPQPQSRWVVSYDIGGSTSDYSLFERLPEHNPMRIRYHGSDTIYCGNTHMVNKIMVVKSMKRQLWESLVAWVMARTSSRSEQDTPIPRLSDNQDLSTVWTEVRSKHLKAINEFLARTIKDVRENVPAKEHETIKWFLTGGGALDPVVWDLYKRTIESEFHQASISNEGFSKSRDSSVLRGQKTYEEFCRSQHAKSSPMSVLALQDALKSNENTHVTDLANDEQGHPTHGSTSHPTADIGDQLADDEKLYIVCVNKDHPLGLRPLLHPTQVHPGEILRFEVSWGDEQDRPTTNIPFYAYADPVEPTLHEGFSCTKFTKVEQAKLFPLGEVVVSKPLAGGASKHLYVKVRTSIWARTVTTTAFMLYDDTDFELGDPEIPKQEQCLVWETKTSGLDSFRMNMPKGH